MGDLDGDGDIDLNELLAAMQELQAEKKQNKRLWLILLVGAVLFALTLGAVFALSIAAAELAKESSVSGGSSPSAPSVMVSGRGSGSPTAGNTVRTGTFAPTLSGGSVATRTRSAREHHSRFHTHAYAVEE